MKERPILFSAPMVRAILDGRKTQTRRVVKPQPPSLHLGYMAVDGGVLLNGPDYPDGDSDFVKCPYGVPGDRLWVRERFLPCKDGRLVDGIDDATYACFVDGSQKYKTGDYFPDSKRFEDCKWPTGAKWRPSIHMPRWASRITLEVVAVRVERLQDISRVDAIAEGAPESHPSIDRVSMDFGFQDFSRSYFAQLWQQINGTDSWSANPWVWVVEFKRI